MIIIYRILIIIVLFFLIAYPFTSLIGTCYSYPLEDYFFPIYWPIANWINQQGISVTFAYPLAVILPNTLILLLIYKLVKYIKNRYIK